VPAEAVTRWAALYRDRQTDQLMPLAATDNKLVAAGGRGGVTWTPMGGARFRSPQGEASLSGSQGRLLVMLVRPAGDTSWLEEVRPAPAVLPVNDYLGTYASDELDVRFVIVAKDGKLFLRRRPADEFELRPVYVDGFQTGGGGLGSMRFARDANGAVTGFSFYAGRVLDVRFKKVAR